MVSTAAEQSSRVGPLIRGGLSAPHGNTLVPGEALNPEVIQHCSEIIEEAAAARTNFFALSETDSGIISARKAAFGGNIFVMTAQQLREGSQRCRGATQGSIKYKDPWRAVGGYCARAYLNINNREATPVDQRGFFSWKDMLLNNYSTDPDFDRLNPDDRLYTAVNDEGKILGHLQITRCPEGMRGLPLNPEKRTPEQRLEIETLFSFDGNPSFISDLIETDPKYMDMTLGQIGFIKRFSREGQGLSRIQKTLITTELAVAAFTDMQQHRKELGLQTLIFDGEYTARRSFRVLGLQVNNFSQYHVVNPPPILIPRYTVNNKGEITPHAIDLDQLDCPRQQRLNQDIENGNRLAYTRLALQKLLYDIVNGHLPWLVKV
jgi:hypothetical protein